MITVFRPLYWWLMALCIVLIHAVSMHYYPLLKARQYYDFFSKRFASLERGDLPFYIERQRRSVLELSRSQYMQNLILYTQGQSSISERQVLKMESFIKVFQGYFGYKQIFLLDKEGNIVFSTVPGLRGKNIKTEQFASSFLVESFDLTAMTLTTDITPFSYDPLVEQKAIFLTMPVFYDGALNGYLAVQIDNGEIERMIASDVNLGATGEYLITQRMKDIITFVVPPKSDPHLTLTVKPGTNQNVGTPAERSALGYSGYGIAYNYQGIKVVSAWYYLPQLNWGFVFKTHYDEVMSYVFLLGYLRWLLLLCAFGITCMRFYIVYCKREDTTVSN